MTPLEQLRALYFAASPASIGEDFDRAIDLFKQLTSDEEREKAAVYMDGIAEMRREWKGRPGAGTSSKVPRAPKRRPTPKPRP